MDLLDFTKSVGRSYRVLLEPIGIDPLELRVLLHVKEAGYWEEESRRRYHWKNLSELARELDEDRKTVARTLERLGRAQLVEVRRASVRRTYVALLDAGEELLGSIEETRRELERVLREELVGVGGGIERGNRSG